MALFNDVVSSSLLYFEGDELAANVFASKYAMTNNEGDILENTPDDMHHRLAREFARIESKYLNGMSESKIYDLLANFKYIVPQGSPMSAIGNDYQLQSLSNCFVIPSPTDSYGGILLADQQQVQIMKRRGGVGFDISLIRPSGLPTSNAAKTTDGIGVFMERFSNSCREVAQGGRRGALLLSIAVEHPDIETFIDIKRDRKKVTGANVSIRISDNFMEAVKNDSQFTLKWPVDSKNPVHTKAINAKNLWNKIIDAAWESAEPGLLFWDTALRRTPSDIYSNYGFRSTSTNPCGEIVLSPYDACRLLLLNLANFVRNPYTPDASFDWALYAEYIQYAQRMMDDIVDLELEKIDAFLVKIDADPESWEAKQVEKNLWANVKDAIETGRRTGLGITALGDCLAALNIRYGSPESIEMTDKVYKELALNAYRSSVQLARERGAFPICDVSLEANHEFLKQIMDLDPQLKKDWLTYGRRNIALTTTAPAGTVSVLTRTTSGIEPTIFISYTRRKKINPNDPDARVDFVDHLGDAWTEFKVFHPGVKRWMEATGKTENDLSESPYWGSTANEIDWKASVDMQAAAQRWVCHSISKTCNLPADVSKDVVKDVYMRAWETGCKGFTVYREGSRTGVLVQDTEKNETAIRTSKFIPHDAPKRPEVLPCDIHQVTIKGEEWTILVGLYDSQPYEIMGGFSKFIDIPKKHKTGKLIKKPLKHKASVYDLVIGEEEDALRIKDVVSTFENPNHAAFTRMLSLSLRHGTKVNYIVEQLQKGDPDADLFSFTKVISRVIKKYIVDGTAPGGGTTCTSCGAQNSLQYIEGCVTCIQCAAGKCG